VVSGARGPNKRFWTAAVAIVVVAIGLLAYVMRPKPVREVDLQGDPAQARGYLLGDSTAPLQIIEFADFECPACAQFATLTEPDIRRRLIATGEASYRFYDFPLPMHRNTWAASNAAACADEQGRFWEMHDRLFERQDEWNGEATGRPKGIFTRLAREVGLDEGRFEQCYDEDRYRSRIAANRAEAERRQVGSTPTFIIGVRGAPGGARVLPGTMGIDEFMRNVNEIRGGAGGGVPNANPAAPGAGPRR
jgi:protein-disulfide isomerase